MATASRDFQACEICNRVVRPASAFAAHLASAEHLERARGNFVRCPACAICIGKNGWSSHVAGARHLRAVASQGLRPDIPSEIPASVPGHRKCHICAIFVNDRIWEEHKQWASHRRFLRDREEIEALREVFRQAQADKEGVTVSGVDGVSLGLVDIANVAQGARTHLIAKADTSMKFVHAQVRPSSGLTSSTSFSVQQQGTSALIQPGTEFHIVVHFRPFPPNIGRYSANVEILFENTSSGQSFIIVRSVTAVVGNQTDHEILAPVAPFVRPPRRLRRATGGVVRFQRPKALIRHPYKKKLKPYFMPTELSDALENGSPDVGHVIKRLPPAFRPAPLTSSTYVKQLETQLWVEEHKAVLDMQIFDMFDQQLDQQEINYYLAVPGLAENRPSVIQGDGVLLQRRDQPDGRWYEGVVHDVRRDAVGLRFPPSFQVSPTMRYSVRFTFNRFPLRRQHQALNRPFMDDRIFFPVAMHVRTAQTPLPAIELYNGLIAANPNQLLAVKTIVSLPPAAHPFIVFGPPGTGKTVTIVEAILQLLRAKPTPKILACAPSNSASDLIAERLLAHLDKTQLLRFYAPSRNPGLSPASVLEAAFRPDRTTFAVPDDTYASNFQVIVATCVGAAFAHNIDMPVGHFDYIFVDEAGQGTEPEAMVSIKGMAGPKTNIILSGDPKQLRPVIRSGVAVELGLGKSYLERLMQRAIYDETDGHGRTLVKLVRNFRSHQHILDFPNRTFYGGDLRAHANPRVVDMFVQWRHHPQPNRRFPVIFHAIPGNDEQESSSPSYFNRLEASQVKTYLQWLLAGGSIEAKDIGVITPYHAQAKKIRQILLPFAADTRVASVELFQGEERKVIIISTVRSKQDLLGYDLKHTLGFVGNPRRFNVAMTRAQALLIVVGDPAVLGLDPLWRSWLNFVYTRGGWTGSSGPSWDPEAEVREGGGYDREIQELGLDEMRALTARMEALSMGQNVAVENDHGGAYERAIRDVE